MRAFACLVVLLLAGCSGAPPVVVLDSPDVTAALGVELATAMVRSRHEFRPPPPAPVSQKCANCAGTGKLGDGNRVYTCPICKGTGLACVSGTCGAGVR